MSEIKISDRILEWVNPVVIEIYEHLSNITWVVKEQALEALWIENIEDVLKLSLEQISALVKTNLIETRDSLQKILDRPLKT